MKLNELDTLIPQYALNKQELDCYKKICDQENAQIKDIMRDFAVQKYEADGYKASYTVSKRETMNEDILLEIAHKYNLDCVIKTKEYIDFDELENQIYNGAITEDILMQMDKAKEIKEVVTLRVTKIKKQKGEN